MVTVRDILWLLLSLLALAVALILPGLASAQPWTSMTPGTWYEYPSSRADSVKQPASAYPDWNGSSSAFYNQCEGGPTSNVGFTAIMTAWSGGAYDPVSKKLYIWGGGHGDYCGNEVLSFNLVSGTWTRETDRWLYVDQGTAPNSYTDQLWEQPYGSYGNATNTAPQLSQPRSTHTYGALQFLTNFNALCSYGMPSTSHGSVGNPASHILWCWNAGTKVWQQVGNLDPNTGFSVTRGMFSAVDPRNPNVVWAHNTTYDAHLYRCTAASGTSISCVSKTPNTGVDLEQTGFMDNAGYMWSLGKGYALRGGPYDLTATGQQPGMAGHTITGDTSILGQYAPGVAYLPGANRAIIWAGGTSIHVLNPDTSVITTRTPHASNTVNPGDQTNEGQTSEGSFGRFRCDESIGICVVVNYVNQNVFLYRLPTDLANPPAHTLALTNNGPLTVPLATAQNVGVSATITATATGSNLLVTFSATPAGSPTFTPTTCTPSGGTQQCTTTFAYPPIPGAQPGTYQVTITGTDSFPSTAQTTVTYTVQQAATSFGSVGALQHDGPATPEQLSIWLPFTGTGSPTYGVPLTVRATVRYRQAGSSTWKIGHEMSRIKPEQAQPGTAGAVTPGFSWPILDLSPGTAYETEVTLTDSATSATEVRTGTFTTRALPGTTGAANKFATVGMDGAALRSLVGTLVPGDILELPVGTYNLNGSPIQVDSSGTENQPIVIRGASKTGTIVQQLGAGFLFYIVGGNHIRIENMTLQGTGVDSGTASNSAAVFMWSNARPQNIVMRDLNISGVDKCLIGTAMDKVMFYNNTCFGNNQWTAGFLQNNSTWNDDATNMPGTGNVAFQNTYKGFGDCASFAFGGHADVQNRGIYFYRNDYDICGDDGVEVDHVYGPAAFYDNRLYNVMTCISIDPLYGGPFIYARNICVNPGRQVFKLTNGNSNWFFYNNTVISTDKNQSFQAGILSFFSSYNQNNFSEGEPQAAFGIQNNIFLSCSGTGRPIYWETAFWVDPSDNLPHVDWTNNSWGLGADTRFTIQPNTWADLATAQANVPTSSGVFTNATKRFTNDTVLNSCQPFAESSVALGANYLTYQPTKFNLAVDVGETAKNSGTVIANITDGYSGAAPDRGAVIDGRAAVTYGCCTGGGAPPGIPATPTNLRKTQAETPTLVQLAWDFTSVPANLEQGFRLYRKLAAAGSYGAAIATIPAGTLTYSDTTVAASTAYHYAVSSYNGSGESALTSNLAATTPSDGGGGLTGAIPILNYRPAYGVNTPGSTPAIEQSVLAKGQFQGLAPSYCTAGRHTLSCAQTQTDMDREIQIAAAAGIKALAFSWFANRSANLGPGGEAAFQASYTLFNSSAQTGVKFALILQPGYLGATDFGTSNTNWQANVDALATILGGAKYQRVLTSRPIVFLYYYAPDITTYFNNSLANLGTAITRLRAQLPSNNPYVVLMMPGSSVATMHSTLGTIGADAISDYYVQIAPASAGSTKTYAAQDAIVQARWPALIASGDAIVPPLQFAGGARPNLRTPSRLTSGIFQRMGELIAWVKGTPAAIAAGQVTAVGTWMAANSGSVPSKAIWIYSAYDGAEGGYPVLPSIGDPPLTQPPYTAGANSGLTALLNAIGPVLYSYR